MTFLEYPKIDTLYNRDEKTFKIVPGSIRRPEFANIKVWEITEKIDGRCMTVTLHDDDCVTYDGRTESSEMSSPLVKYMHNTFPQDKMIDAFRTKGPEVPVPAAITLYGEAYGPKMAPGGGKYRKDIAFRLFDIFISGVWLERSSLEAVASKLNISVVPFITYTTVLPESKSDLLKYFPVGSRVAADENPDFPMSNPEGIVAKSVPLLQNRMGKRVMWKLKLSDFP